MIEILDVKDTEPKKLDITPELAIAAYNTLIQYCRQQEVSEDGICDKCIFDDRCPGYKNMDPADWEEIHYPRMTSNTTIFTQDEIPKQRCDDCKYKRLVYANGQFSFYGCYHKPYTGKWLAEIKNCPEGRKSEPAAG